MAKQKEDPRVDKRKVTMVNVTAGPGDTTYRYEAVDYVRPGELAAYVEEARTRWQHVEVSDEPDAGPGGYHGQTVVDGKTIPATKED